VGDQAMHSSKSEDVIEHTLALFLELASGYLNL